MKLYLYQNTLVVAKDKTEAIQKFKDKLSYVYLEELSEWDIKEIDKVDGYTICVIV